MASSGAARSASDPSVTVIVPCRNERTFLEPCLRSLLDQHDLPAQYEILVVDGMSDDGTREVLGRLAGEDARIRMLDNPRQIAASALNIGISASSSDVIIRVDGHARVAPGFVRASLQLLADHPEAWIVGGPIAHRGRTPFARGAALAMSSWFGVGGARHRREDYQGYAETAAFPAIRRRVFATVGPFDEELVRNQDDEFAFRVTEAGGRIFISPTVKHEYYVRERAGALFRQYLQYGYWKVHSMRKHGKVAAPRHLVPVALVVMAPVSMLGGLLAPSPGAELVVVPIGAYAVLAMTFFAATATRTGDPRLAARATLAAATMHVAYGLGTLLGLLAPRTVPRILRGTTERVSR